MATELIATVHTATLHDALQKAERVAPTKGAAFDRAAGFRLEFSAGQLEIQATDLEVTFAHRMNADVREECSIRLSSGLLTRFVASLPMASEQQVSFSRDDKKNRHEAGKDRHEGGDGRDHGELPRDHLVRLRHLEACA